MSGGCPSNVDNRHSNISNIRGDQFNITVLNQTSKQVLQDLNPVEMDPCMRKECLADTRTNVLRLVINWVEDLENEQNVLWIHGLAGSGKSTLSTTIASHLRKSGNLGAFLFFDRDVAERNNPRAVIRTMAHQISGFHPYIGESIASAIEASPNICLSPMYHQFQRLLVDTLSSSNGLANTAPIVLVLDALDECGTPKDRETLLTVLSDQSSHLHPTIRFIFTSRAEYDILRAFDHKPHVKTLELDIMSRDNHGDIQLYIRHQMANIPTRGTLSLGDNWPGEEVIVNLTDKASGLFIWASTAMEFIAGYDPMQRLAALLNIKAATTTQATLDALYRRALELAGIWDDEDFVSDFRSILGPVLVAQRHLSSDGIDHLFRNSDDRPSIHIISHLGCVLRASPTVRLLHPSFAEFLLTRSRCNNDVWFFDRATQHRIVALKCLQHLDAVLKRNICNLTLSRDLADETLPDHTSYACMFWIDHLCLVSDIHISLVDKLSGFLHLHLLHWFESLSILRRSRCTISAIGCLLDWLVTGSFEQHPIFNLVQDAYHFAQTFSDTIEEHPLLVYMTALPLTPTDSALYKTFHKDHWVPTILLGSQQTWSPLLLLLAGYHPVRSLAFSTDGTRIFAASCPNTVHIWDALSGKELMPPTQIEGHKDMIFSVAFSPDGRHCISASWDTTIRTWDMMSGVEVLPTLQGHKGGVISVAFSSSGKSIVSGSVDETVRIWDATSGAEVLPALHGHRDRVTSVSFSPDDTLVASGSWDCTVRVWNADTGTEDFPPLYTHGWNVWSVAFSPNGTRVAAGSESGIHIWNAVLGTEITSILHHDRRIMSVAFSPDGQRIASGSWNNCVQIWDAESGAELLPALRYHDLYVLTVAFSPDGTRIASGSQDSDIRIWDATSGPTTVPRQPKQGNGIDKISFTADGSCVISESVDGDVVACKLVCRDHSLSSITSRVSEATLRRVNGDWVVDQASHRAVWKLPRSMVESCTDTYNNLLAIGGTSDGTVSVICFPPAAFSSPETRAVDGPQRE